MNFHNNNFNASNASQSNAAYFQQLQKEKQQTVDTALDTQFSYMSMDDPSQSQMNRFQSPVIQQVEKQRSYGNDDKPIKSKGSYALPELDDFDLQNSNY